MNHRRAIGHGLLDFQDGRQNLVLDFDQPQRLFRDGAAFRRDGRHAVAHQAHFGVEQIGVVRRRLRPALTGGGVGHARNILVSQDGMHAGKSLGFGGVNPLDARVRVRAGKNLAVEHSGKVNVVGESRTAGDELEPVHLLRVLPDDGMLGTHRIFASVGASHYGEKNKSKLKTQKSKRKSQKAKVATQKVISQIPTCHDQRSASAGFDF